MVMVTATDAHDQFSLKFYDIVKLIVYFCCFQVYYSMVWA